MILEQGKADDDKDRTYILSMHDSRCQPCPVTNHRYRIHSTLVSVILGECYGADGLTYSIGPCPPPEHKRSDSLMVQIRENCS